MGKISGILSTGSMWKSKENEKTIYEADLIIQAREMRVSILGNGSGRGKWSIDWEPG